MNFFFTKRFFGVPILAFGWLCGIALFASFTLPSSSARASEEQTYIVLYKKQAVPGNAADIIASAGGVLVFAYADIGVVIARSES